LSWRLPWRTERRENCGGVGDLIGNANGRVRGVNPLRVFQKFTRLNAVTEIAEAETASKDNRIARDGLRLWGGRSSAFQFAWIAP
jgi:hypothetical protein